MKIEIKITKEIDIDENDNKKCGNCEFLDYWYCNLFDTEVDCEAFFPIKIGKMRADECLEAEENVE